MRIGYQGDAGSNAEEAAKQMSIHINEAAIELIPLISSKNVMEQLEQGEIEYGVMAVSNSIGGIVQETAEAIRNKKVKEIASVIVPIHHCLFKRSCAVSNNSLNKVVSHIQALKQTEQTRMRLFSYLLPEEIEDTAVGARWLREGKLSDTTAVICRKNAGEMNQLTLVKANIEDDPDNQTLFKMYKW